MDTASTKLRAAPAGSEENGLNGKEKGFPEQDGSFTHPALKGPTQSCCSDPDRLHLSPRDRKTRITKNIHPDLEKRDQHKQMVHQPCAVLRKCEDLNRIPESYTGLG